MIRTKHHINFIVFNMHNLCSEQLVHRGFVLNKIQNYEFKVVLFITVYDIDKTDNMEFLYQIKYSNKS